MALAAGMAGALEAAVRDLDKNCLQVAQLRRCFLDSLLKTAAPVVVNGPPDGIPHIVNVSFPGCQADRLLIALDLAGVACSTGSACSSGSLLPSPVLRAMSVSDDILHSAMRFSFDSTTTIAEVSDAAGRIAKAVAAMRR